MSLQDTVLELFEAKRLDKAAAYRLLNVARSGTDAASSPAASKWHRVLEQPVRLHVEQAWRLMLAACLLRIAGGQDQVRLLWRGQDGERLIQLSIDDTCTPRSLWESVAVQCDAQPPLAASSDEPYAWLADGQRDNAARQVVIAELPSAGLAPRELML
jgi:hypothetical protein